MPKRDNLHEVVKKALLENDWIITHDPYFLRLGKRKGFIDLAAQLISAEKETDEGLKKIAVEIKSFAGLSEVDEFEDALGQFLIYKVALERKEPDRVLFLALPQEPYEKLFDDAFFKDILRIYQVQMLVFDPLTLKNLQWIIL